LEMSRQRLRPSLSEALHTVCPRCEGRGTVRGVESLSLTVIRIIEEHSLKENTAIIRAQLPVSMATYILNEKRSVIVDMERRQGVLIQIIANPHMHSPQYEIERIRTHEAKFDTSYKLMSKPEEDEEESGQRGASSKKPAEPALKSLPIPEGEPPKPRKRNKRGLIGRLLDALFGEKKAKRKKLDRNRRHRHKGQGRRSHSHGDKRRPQHQAKKHHRDSGKDKQGDNNKPRHNKDNQKGAQGEPKSSKPRRHHNRRRNNKRNNDNQERGNKDNQDRGNKSEQGNSTPPTAENRSNSNENRPAPQSEAS